MGLDEMTGSPNLTIVADPSTFRTLPWAPGVGWILGDEYFNDGTPFHFSPRQLLRKGLRRLEGSVVSSDRRPRDRVVSAARRRGSSERRQYRRARHSRPPDLRSRPVEPGYHYHSESNMELMQPVFDALGDAFEELGLGTALDRKRVGSWASRMHLRAARRAAGG